jgi:DNA-binding XRE family transcriptional regulator
MKTKANRNGVAAKRVTVKGKRMVMLEEGEFDRLLHKADEWEPLLPESDADGNYPALEALRVSLARKIIRDRRHLGLTQADLARRAGIRPESLNRIEQGRVTPSIRTIEKIDRALRKAGATAMKGSETT